MKTTKKLSRNVAPSILLMAQKTVIRQQNIDNKLKSDSKLESGIKKF